MSDQTQNLLNVCLRCPNVVKSGNFTCGKDQKLVVLHVKTMECPENRYSGGVDLSGYDPETSSESPKFRGCCEPPAE